MPSSEVMHKFKKGKLKSGSGQTVKSRSQAIAIMMSEKRKERKHGGRYPEKQRKHNPSPQAGGGPHGRCQCAACGMYHKD